MPKPSKGPRLGGSPSHQRLILANLATALFEHGRITTTEAKARRLRPLAEKLITKARRGDLAARRQVLRTVRDKSVVHALFTEIGPSFANRPGGYTRITKIGPRRGDNAPMAVIELVEEEAPAATTTRRTSPARRRRAAEPAEVEEAAEAEEAPEAEEAEEQAQEEPAATTTRRRTSSRRKQAAEASQEAEEPAEESAATTTGEEAADAAEGKAEEK